MVRGSSSCRNDVHSLDLKGKVRISTVPLSSDVKRIEDVACVVVPSPTTRATLKDMHVPKGNPVCRCNEDAW